MHLRASPSIRDSADRVWVIGPLELQWDMWVREFNRGRRRHFEVDVTRAQGTGVAMNSRRRKLLPDCFLFALLELFALIPSRWPVLFQLFYLTYTSPTRYAPRRSRNLPRNTPSQASDDVQCYAGEGHPGNVQEIHGQCMWFLATQILSSNSRYSPLKFLSMTRQS
jgi:hypothetical protein